MANLPEVNEFTAGVYQLEENDPVFGGVNGKSNLPLKALANRTLFLKNAIEALETGGGPFEYSAAAGVVPQFGSDGAGTAGVRRKDLYWVTIAGNVNGTALQPGDQLIAKQDDADHISEYIVLQSNLDLATPTVIGLVKLVQNLSGGPQADAVLSVTGLINLFAQLASPTFTGNPTVPDQTQGVSDGRIANRKHVVDAVAAEATARIAADNAEATARVSSDNAEATARASADTAINNAIGNRNYTNQNILTNSESLTASLNKLDSSFNSYGAVNVNTLTQPGVYNLSSGFTGGPSGFTGAAELIVNKVSGEGAFQMLIAKQALNTAPIWTRRESSPGGGWLSWERGIVPILSNNNTLLKYQSFATTWNMQTQSLFSFDTNIFTVSQYQFAKGHILNPGSGAKFEIGSNSVNIFSVTTVSGQTRISLVRDTLLENITNASLVLYCFYIP